MGELTHVAQEAIDGHRVVKAFGGQARAAERFSFVNEDTRSLQMKMVATNAISVPLVQLVSAIAIAVIVYLSTMQGLREDISVGTFMSFILAMGLLLQPIKSLTGINNQLQRGIIAADGLLRADRFARRGRYRRPDPGQGPGAGGDSRPDPRL